MNDLRQQYEIETDGPPQNPFSGRFQILALSGGGYRGVFTAALLANLEKEGGPLRQRFDLLAGTSIGSILAGALAVGVSAQDCLKAMRDHGTMIFPGGRLRRAARTVKQVAVKAAYKSEPLEQAIRAILKEESDRPLNEIAHPLIIPCVSHTRAELRVLRSKGIAGREADETTLIDAMLASAAAPTYFPARKLKTEIVVDGGLIANAPELIALTEAVNQRAIEIGKVRVCSIGTANSSLSRAAEKAKAPSIMGWIALRGLFETTMHAQERMASKQCEMLLGKRYLRLDAEPSTKQAAVIALDKAGATAVETLEDLADVCWQQCKPSESRVVSELLRHRVPDNDR